MKVQICDKKICLKVGKNLHRHQYYLYTLIRSTWTQREHPLPGFWHSHAVRGNGKVSPVGADKIHVSTEADGKVGSDADI